MIDVRDRDRNERYLAVSDTPSYQEEGRDSCYICQDLTQAHLPIPHKRHNLVAQVLMNHLVLKDWDMTSAVMQSNKVLNVVDLNVNPYRHPNLYLYRIPYPNVFLGLVLLDLCLFHR